MKYLILLLLFIVGCNSKDPSLTPINGISGTGYEIKVFVEGSEGNPFTVILNDEETLRIPHDGIYSFQTTIPLGLFYHVRVHEQPTGRTCASVKPTAPISSVDNTVRIQCTSSTKGFVWGQIEGLDAGELTMKAVAASGNIFQSVEVSAGSQSFFFETPMPLTSVDLSIITQPLNKKCTFDETLTTISLGFSGTSIIRADVRCRPYSSNTTSFNLKFNNLGNDSLTIFTNGGGTSYTGTGAPSFTQTAAFSGNFNERKVFEITALKNGSTDIDTRRCYFKESGNHLFSVTPAASPYTIEIDCVTRTPNSCERGSLEYPSTNGKLNDVNCAGGRLFYGGQFNLTGRQLGIVPYNPTANAQPLVEYYDRIHGSVHTIESDSYGSWYVGGSFNRVGDKNIYNIARLDSRLMLDENFKVSTDGRVDKIIKEGSQLYVLGDFTRVRVNNVPYDVPGFFTIDLSSSVKYVPLTFPKNISTVSGERYAMALYDSYLYFHGKFMVNAVPQRVLIRMNRYNGKVVTRVTNAPELGTQFWQESYQSPNVWMVNNTQGLVNPVTGVPHPQSAKIPTGSQYTYFIDLIGNLYVSSGTEVRRMSLHALSSNSLQPFGKISGISYNIENAGEAYYLSNKVCFMARTNQPVKISSSTFNSVACFDDNGGPLTAFSLPVAQVPLAIGSSGQFLMLAVPYHNAYASQSFSVVDANKGTVALINPNLSATEEINSIATDGSDVYLAGNFINFNGCLDCNHIAKFSSSGLDTNWSLQEPLEAPAKKIVINGTKVLIATGEPGRELILTETNSSPMVLAQVSLPAPPKDVALVTNGVLTQEGNTKVFRDTNLQEVSTMSSSHAFVGLGDFWIANVSPYVNRYREDGSYVVQLPLGAYGASAKLTTLPLQNSVCLYNGAAVSCGDESLVVSPTIPSLYETADVFKGIGNFLFIGRGKVAPLIHSP